MNEIKAQVNPKYDITEFSLQNVPLKVAITSSYGDVIISFEIIKGYLTFDGNLTDKDFKRYKKEIVALFKDFDDIYGEFNTKHNLSTKLNEIRSRYNKNTDFTEYDLSNLPVTIDLGYSYGGAIIVFDVTNPIETYEGNLTDKDFRSYKKEMTNLFKDFDDIFKEVNNKFKLKLEK